MRPNSFLTGVVVGAGAMYLLDPESDDGLATWNFFDAQLAVGRPYPVMRLSPSR